MQSRGPLAAVVVLLLVNVCWGVNVAVVKLAVNDVSPYAFNAIRTCLGTLIMLPLGLRAGMLRRLAANPRGFLIGGALGVTVTQTAYGVSLALAPGSIIAILSALGPLLLVFMSTIFLHERVGRVAWLGLAVAFFGVLLVLGFGRGGLETNGSDTLIGSIVVLSGIVAWYSFQLVAKSLLEGESAMSMAVGTMVVGSIGLVVVFVGVDLGGASPNSDWSTWALVAIGFSGVINGAFAFLALNWALQRLQGARAGGLSYVHVVVGVLSSWALIGEDLGVTFVFGAAFVLAGVYIVSRASITGGRGPVLEVPTSRQPTPSPIS